MKISATMPHKMAIELGMAVGGNDHLVGDQIFGYLVFDLSGRTIVVVASVICGPWNDILTHGAYSLSA